MVERLSFAFAIPMVLTLILTPLVFKLAVALRAIDYPTERKIHRDPVPRLGGLAIFFSFVIGMVCALAVLIDSESSFHSSILNRSLPMLLASFVLIVSVGVADDKRSLSPRFKLVCQVVAATAAYIAGCKISAITHPLGSGLLHLGWLEYPATIIWIILVTNAINLIDGLDGLAAGVAIMATITMAAIALLNGDSGTALVASVLAGSIVGFLRYNFHPAKIFLGDSGSLFLGFSLAVLSIESTTKGSTAIAIIAPMLALGFPIVDTMLSIVRRFVRPPRLNGKSASLGRRLSAIFSADREHIHHRMLASGWSHRRVVLLLYVVSLGLSLMAFTVSFTGSVVTPYAVAGFALATIMAAKKLGYNEMALFRNGSLLPLFQFPLLKRTLFLFTLDGLLLALAMVATLMIIPANPDLQSSIPPFVLGGLIILIQLAVISTNGIYRISFHQLGLGDAVRITRGVALAVLVGVFALYLLPGTWPLVTPGSILIEFYLVLSLVLGSRISYHVLHYLFKREASTGRRILIYGARHDGALILQHLMRDDQGSHMPVGFIDEDPRLEGMCINGYPVFGGHWKLSALLRKYSVDEIILSHRMPECEALKQVKQIAEAQGITVRILRIELETLLTGSLNQNDRQGAKIARPNGEMPESNPR